MESINNKLERSWAKAWHLFLWQGIFAVLVGILTFIWPVSSLATLVIVFGVLAIMDGIMTIVQYAQGKILSGGWALLYAAFSILAGIGVLLAPGLSAMMLVVFVSVWAVVGGIFRIMIAIDLRKQIAGEGWMIASGMLSIAFGVLLLAMMAKNPLFGVVTLAQIIGTFVLVLGILLIVSAINMKNLGKDVEKLLAA